MQSQRKRLVVALLTVSGLLAGCSGASPSVEDEGATPTAAPIVTPTAQTVASQEAAIVAAPGDAFATIPSTTPGIATWTFHASPNGIVAIGADASGAARAELSMLSVSNGSTLQVTGTAYLIADSLPATPAAVIAGLTRDIDTQTLTDVGSEVFEVDGLVTTPDAGVVMRGMSALVHACGTTALGLINGAFIATGTMVVGATMEAACPITFGGGCVGGAAVAMMGSSYAAGQICPNLPTNMMGAVKSILTPTPAM